MFKRKPNKGSSIGTLIGARTRIDGDVEFSGGLHLDGSVNGNLNGVPGSDSHLSVSAGGTVEGSVLADNVVVNGLVRGDIDAAGRVELGEKARVLGNVRYSVIETAVGAQINGKLIHRGESADGGTEADPAPGRQL